MKKIIFVAALLVLNSSLLISANATESYFNVRDFGATGNGTNLDSPSIDKAIDACASAGGGTVYVPAGTYLSGSIHLKSNIHLLIAAGATILGAPQTMQAYDFTEAWPTNNNYQDGGHCYFHNSLIWGENLTNVFITGNGMINGGDLQRSDGILNKMCGFTNEQKKIKTYGAETNADGAIRLGNKAIALKLCRNVLIRDVTIFHGGHFAILVTGCDNLTVDNVTMDTDRDGIDIDCCRNTMVSNCRINSPNDDALCPKSSFALGRNVPTENLMIVNCEVSGFKEGTLIDGTMLTTGTTNHNGRIKFGTEANGGFRNCTVANCTFRGCKGLALEEVDGGIMDNIVINNITMMDVDEYPIYITTGNRNRGPNVTSPSVARRIFISNVIADGVGALSGIQITGLKEQPIEDLRLENIRLNFNGGGTKEDAKRVPPEFEKVKDRYPEPKRVGKMPSYAVFARHVRNLEMANITTTFVTNDYRPAIVAADVKGLKIENFKAQVAPKVSPTQFADDVTCVTIRHSPSLKKSFWSHLKFF